MNLRKLSEIFYPVYNPHKFCKDIFSIKSKLKAHGIVLIKDVFTNADALRIAEHLGVSIKNIDADIDGITDIFNKGQGANNKNSSAFSKQELILHTDRSPIAFPPDLLMNWMCIKDCQGGETVLVDGYKIFEDISHKHADMLNVLIQDDIACFTDGIDTFTGPIFHIDKNNKLTVRFRNDQCAFFKIHAKKAIRIFLETAARLSHVIDLNLGSGYIIDNKRWLHGRRSFNGSRMVRRIHIKGNF